MTSSPDSPLRLFQEWFDQLPPDIRTDVCWQLCAFAPDGIFPAVDEGSHGAADVETVRALVCREPRDPLDEAGRVVVLAALVDFVFVNRSTKEQWDAAEERMTRAAEYAKQRGLDSMLATATTAGSRLPSAGACGFAKPRRGTPCESMRSQLRVCIDG